MDVIEVGKRRDLDQLKVSETAYGSLLLKATEHDYELYPHQVEAIRHIDAGKSVVLSVPTAAGKTVVAYHAIIRAISSGGKAMYVAPLRALASEKYRELRVLRDHGIRVGMSIGDHEVDTETLKKMRVLVCTSEKADSIMRHDPDFIRDFQVVVTDETHLLGDPGRGPILEMFLTSARVINPDLQLVSLSATISNREEIGKWLGAEMVVSDFRPVPMRYGILNGKKLVYDNEEVEEYRGNEIASIVKKHCDEGGQVLIFRGSRKKAEDAALDLAESLDFGHGTSAKSDAEEVDRHEEILDSIIRKGIAFHHAGLSSDRREKIEEGFRNGKIKVIAATPTLASGVNLPARAVIVRDITRFSSGYSDYLPVSEVRQMLGRAGRPSFDRIGYGIIFASSENGLRAARNYIESEPEPIESGLGSPPKVRFCVLGLVSMGLVKDRESLAEFFGKTLYSKQKGSDRIAAMADSALDFLMENEFVQFRNGEYRATRFGEASSNLYIDPVTALKIREYLESGSHSEERALITTAMTPDMPKLYYTKDEAVMYEGFLESAGFEVEDEESLGAAKIAMVLRDWISEKGIREISEKYNVGHGDIQARATVAEWIMFSMSRLAAILRPELSADLDLLSLRVKEGVGSEVLALTALRGIGRVRARRLYRSGYTTILSIANAQDRDISAIAGFSSKLSGDIIAQARRISGAGK